MKKELWFPTPIWYDQLDFDREKIKQACYKLKELDSEGRTISNFGGWQSTDIVSMNLPEFNEFLSALNDKCKEVYSDITPNFEGVLGNAWVNIHGPNAYNRLHFHCWSTLSGCVYINVEDDSGDIVFRTPTPQVHYPFNPEDNPLFFESVTYKPTNNKIIVFPAWLAHETFPSPNSREDRISISFNIIQSNFLKDR